MINRSYLREVSSRWQGRVVDGKTDISPQDARIIDILLDYFINKEEYELVQVLSDWKRISDSEFLDKLKKFTDYESLDISHPEESSKEGSGGLEDLLNSTFVELWGMMIPIQSIGFVEKGSEYDDERNRVVFYLEINPKKRVSYKPNIKKSYVTEELRDEQLEILREKLIEFGVKFI